MKFSGSVKFCKSTNLCKQTCSYVQNTYIMLKQKHDIWAIVDYYVFEWKLALKLCEICYMIYFSLENGSMLVIWTQWLKFKNEEKSIESWKASNEVMPFGHPT